MGLLSLPAILLASVLLRLGMLFYGLYQDAHSALPYTDIDYYVFTDASRFIAAGQSPYDRATYRYTPLLAHLLLPTTFAPQSLWFSFGKVLFAVGDVVAGFLIYQCLRERIGERRALIYTSTCWLLNPMVATISTRGSSEGLLGVMVMAIVYTALKQRDTLCGVFLGLATHFKIYPVIYGPAILLWMEEDAPFSLSLSWIASLLTLRRIRFTIVAAATFAALNAAMYLLYGHDFIQQTFLHHISRLDHRHNFSPYNTLLYIISSPSGASSIPFASLAFVPQMLLSALILPLTCAKKGLPETMALQTIAFVAFNKVCTSQYFMWYLVLLPFVLPGSSFVERPKRGIAALAAWVGAQALWLEEAWRLEFLGRSTFWPGLAVGSALFFGVSCWILGAFVEDLRMRPVVRRETRKEVKT